MFMLIKVQVMDIILLLLSEQQQRCDYFFHTSYFQRRLWHFYLAYQTAA